VGAQERPIARERNFHSKEGHMAWATNPAVQNANTTLLWTLSGGSLNPFDTIEVGQLGGNGAISITDDARLPGGAVRLTVQVRGDAVSFRFRGGLIP